MPQLVDSEYFATHKDLLDFYEEYPLGIVEIPM
jgi:hypothetical protein